MVIQLYIRRVKGNPAMVTMRTDFKRESLDTPRISNFGLDIKEQIDEMIKKCEAKGELKV